MTTDTVQPVEPLTVGLVGAGNMARAIAVGLKQLVLTSDSGSGRAAALASETGGQAVETKLIGEQADIIFLCHKPAQLDLVAQSLQATSAVVVSVLAGVGVDQLAAAYPHQEVYRIMPNIAVERNTGVVVLSDAGDGGRRATVVDLLQHLGQVVVVPEDQMEVATAVGGCAPAFFALFASQLVQAAVGRGMTTDVAATIVNHTMSGTAEMLDANGFDTDAVISAVASPGGATERALASFESAELAGIVEDAVAAVTGSG